MTRVTILFGTESGNAEMAADDIGEVFAAAGVDHQVVGMENFTVEDLCNVPVVVLVTSTYGDGDLPETSAPFYDSLQEQRPDLSSGRFAAFGLGDSSYDTFNNAVTTLVAALKERGSTQLGPIGLHDADSGLSAGDVAAAWAKEIVDLL